MREGTSPEVFQVLNHEESDVAMKALCNFSGCSNKVIAKGLCPSHYRQKSRGAELKALREVNRGLVRLPMVIRVTPETLELLKQRIREGKAVSMYDATRQALEAGIATWPLKTEELS